MKASKRIRLRRGQKAIRLPPPATCTFKELREGQIFFLTPEGTTRMMWLKVCSWGAQYTDWDNDSSYPDQQFPPDYPVYTKP